jgi:hypothetical protein
MTIRSIWRILPSLPFDRYERKLSNFTGNSRTGTDLSFSCSLSALDRQQTTHYTSANIPKLNSHTNKILLTTSAVLVTLNGTSLFLNIEHYISVTSTFREVWRVVLHLISMKCWCFYRNNVTTHIIILGHFPQSSFFLTKAFRKLGLFPPSGVRKQSLVRNRYSHSPEYSETVPASETLFWKRLADNSQNNRQPCLNACL